MNCESCLEKMSLYIDKNLPEAEASLLEEHIKRCPECMEELEMLKMMVNALEDMEDEPLPEKFHKDLMIKVEEKSKEYRFKKLIRYFSGVAAVLLVGILLVNYQPSPKDIQYAQDAPPSLKSVRVQQDVMPQRSRMVVLSEVWKIKTTNSQKIQKIIDEFSIKHNLTTTKDPQENNVTIGFTTNALKQELLTSLKASKEVTAFTVSNSADNLLNVKISFE